MMLPNEKIQDEIEFKHACNANAYEVERILRWIHTQKHNQILNEKSKQKQQDLIWFCRNIESLISEVTAEQTNVTPEFSV